jgi:hypothetical protein
MAEGVGPPRDDEPRRDEDLLPVPRAETLPEPVVAEARSTELGFPTGRQPPSTYAPRFRMLIGALVGVAIGALAATAYLISEGKPEPGPAWSSWKPTDDDLEDGAQQIARHVGAAYRLPSGEQLVLVTGGPLRLAGLDLPVRIAVQGAARESRARSVLGGASGAGAGAGNVSLVEGKSAMYQLCGLGPRCSIASGKPSTERFLLLRRESLELALYSFRYLDVDNVVTLMPPAPGKKPENALFFRRDDYEPSLDRPLRATLRSPPPTLNSLPHSPEAVLIERMTEDNVFRYAFQQGQDLGALLVLAPLPSS